MSHCSSAPLYLYLSIRSSTLDTVGGIVADGPRVARDESLNQNDVLAIYHGTIYHLPIYPWYLALHTPLSVSRGPLVTLSSI